MKLQTLSPYAPFVIRVVLGIIFILHGVMKFMALGATIGFFSHIGVPLATIVAPLIGAVEVLGGLSLILGLGSRVFSILLALDMLAAIVMAKLGAGLVGGFEFELALFAGLLSLFLSGPGALAINRRQNSVLA
ncbi:DoxX family protein [Ktedonosporobacter rubrisoli]|uniref:DoxX family protein n=1 Tax=Ktedonosporobacter rubrisoli TaxID=2509675 RepID=A0A4V0YY89_KTERU|nr:DoxX family protein [Ktedonosporobacter rubrisoli]QBD75381.1 DoxX family protein [Ktedonosporobacter rubrisoli]